MKNEKQLEITQLNQMPINQQALNILYKIQQQDQTQRVADYCLHLVQLLQWAILETGIQVRWANQDLLFSLLMKMEERLSPQKLYEELTMLDDMPMIDEDMMRGNPYEVAEDLLEAWVDKLIDQGIIWTRDDLDLD